MIMVPVGEVVQVGPLNFLGQVGFLCPEIFEAPFCDHGLNGFGVGFLTIQRW